ncbi:hypothetical protein ABIB25_000694 [Nakamurella sp. UYEF19]|uniref:septum formation family protein n=1 Tax=Nakamurella sp. UYEF19 TaxID=1756392 RepID=UPI00339846BC
MTRRRVGGALFVLILVVVLCVPGIIGRSLAGAASPAVHVDPRPRVGDCLAPLDTPDQLNSVLDAVPIVACSQAHSAEILAVGSLDHKIWPKRPTVMDGTFTGGALSSRCDQLAGQFLAWGQRTALPRIPVSFFTRLTVPNDLQWKLGQRWWACELMPSLLDYPISYQGTARDASIATPPSAFAICSDGPGELRTPCDRPHHAEQLTRSYGNGADVNLCPQLVGAVIGTSDPTFKGQLAVLARTDSSTVGCWITTTSSRKLTATLINHGSAPLPLS